MIGATLLLLVLPAVLSAPVTPQPIRVEVSREEHTGSYEILLKTPYFERSEIVLPEGAVYGEIEHKFKNHSKPLTYTIISDKSLVSLVQNIYDEAESELYDVDKHETKSEEINPVAAEEVNNVLPAVSSAPVTPQPIRVEVTREEHSGSYEILLKTPYFERSEIVLPDGAVYGEIEHKFKHRSNPLSYTIISDKSLVYIVQNIFGEEESERYDVDKQETEGDAIDPVVIEKNDISSTNVVRLPRSVEDQSTTTEITEDNTLEDSSSSTEYIPVSVPSSTEGVPIISVQNVEELTVDFGRSVHYP